MSLVYIRHPDLGQLRLLAESSKAGPEWEHLTLVEVAEKLAEGSQCFEVDGRGLMLVRVVEGGGKRVLRLEAASVRGPWIRGWVKDMRRLAADWRCDAVETIVYDKRLARAMLLCGVKARALVLELEV